MSFGDELGRLMAERGVGVRELARIAHYTPGHISKLRKGERLPSDKAAARLEAILRGDGKLTAAYERDRRYGAIPAVGLSAEEPDGPARAMLLRLESMSAGQLNDLLVLLDQQWHALVKTDNLLGPRAALGGVRTYLEVIDALLRTARSATRARVLALGARYAESAAWLYEDSSETAASRYWAGRSMEYAVEGGDRLMVAWTLFRRSQQATADGDAAQVAGLAAAARREAGELPGPMLAAILQQEAHAHALDGDEVTCHASLDRALELAAADDPGDASAGHGSFCTPAYLEMQRGACWLKLSHPSRALSAYESAVGSLPSVYRRDRGVALSGKAAALAAVGNLELAAVTARQALGIARDSGSGRIEAMVTSDAGLRAALSEFPAL
jgi:transcriptional regulator with XRE-family HTH domain